MCSLYQLLIPLILKEVSYRLSDQPIFLSFLKLGNLTNIKCFKFDVQFEQTGICVSIKLNPLQEPKHATASMLLSHLIP